MNITPDTNIRLLKCPLKLDNKNQITFNNLTSQYNYFSSLPYLEVEGSMYQRKDSSIYYPGLYDDLFEYDYVMYQNDNYNNKWFYAYITGMEYINDNMTRISIATDVFQTWQFDLEYKASYVEREMIDVSSDVPGANLNPEGLESGEYKVGGTAEINDLNPVSVWAYSSNHINILGTEHQILTAASASTMFVNGLPTSLVYLVTTTNQAYADVAFSLENYGNQSEYVVAHFTVPYTAVKGIMNALDEPYSGLSVVYGTSTGTTQSLVSTPNTLDGYTPVNQKLRQYPYMYVAFNPSQGTSKVFRYEDFSNGTPSFKIISEVNPNPTVYFVPQNYRGQSGNSMSDIVSLNGYPQLSSRVDVYNSWLAENSGIINVQTNQNYANAQLDIIGNSVGLFSGLGSMLGTAVGGGGTETAGPAGGMIGSAISLKKTAINYDSYIAQLNAQKERQALLPDNVTLGGSNATLLGYELFNDNIFTRYSIKYQFAKRIDDYFSMYGYQTNELKIPNINNRPKWNYVKTAGINLLGDIPQEDLQMIKDIYDNGVTLWHDTAHFLDYSQNNR